MQRRARATHDSARPRGYGSMSGARLKNAYVYTLVWPGFTSRERENNNAVEQFVLNALDDGAADEVDSDAD